MTRPDLVARGAANPQTIREHLEAIQRLGLDLTPRGWSNRMRCIAHVHAVAALDLLDNALTLREADLKLWAALHGRVISDPAPRGDADA